MAGGQDEHFGPMSRPDPVCPVSGKAQHRREDSGVGYPHDVSGDGIRHCPLERLWGRKIPRKVSA